MPGVRLARERLALGDLALVVRKDQIGASAVEIERGSVLVHRHRRALDVPSRTADSEGRPPGRLVGARRLPQDEVERRPTTGIVGITAPSASQTHHLVLRVVGELPVLGKRGHVVVHGAVGQVRVSRFEEPTDEILDERNGVGGSRFGHRWAHPECIHVDAEPLHLGLGQVEIRDTELAGLREDRVVDVSDVADHPYVVTQFLQASDQEVVRKIGRCVAEVGGVVRRDAADVHAHDRGRFEGNDLAPGGVVQAQSHSGLDAAKSDAPPSAVTEVRREQDGGESLEAHGVVQRATVEGAHAGNR